MGIYRLFSVRILPQAPCAERDSVCLRLWRKAARAAKGTEPGRPSSAGRSDQHSGRLRQNRSAKAKWGLVIDTLAGAS